MTVSPEVEELVKRVMRVGDYASENEVLLAALQALGERRQADQTKRQEPSAWASPLGMQLRELRAQYEANGGDLLTAEQLDGEMAQRRSERNPGDQPLSQQRTFIDSGVLLAAFKAGGELAEHALTILGDPERQFVTRFAPRPDASDAAERRLRGWARECGAEE